MTIRERLELSVGDLKKYLIQNALSPERFAKGVKLSHMTIRRWLEKDETAVLPSKYTPALRPVFRNTSPSVKRSVTEAFQNQSISALMEEIENTGQNFRAIKKLETTVRQKLRKTSLDQSPDKILQLYCGELIEALESSDRSSRVKAIAAGALLYFVDSSESQVKESQLIDYLGHFTILSLALNEIYALRSSHRSVS